MQVDGSVRARARARRAPRKVARRECEIAVAAMAPHPASLESALNSQEAGGAFNFTFAPGVLPFETSEPLTPLQLAVISVCAFVSAVASSCTGFGGVCQGTRCVAVPPEGHLLAGRAPFPVRPLRF